jgi:hypothetical protein
VIAGALQQPHRRPPPHVDRDVQHLHRNQIGKPANAVRVPPVPPVNRNRAVPRQMPNVDIRVTPLADAEIRLATRIVRVINIPALPSQNIGNRLGKSQITHRQ